MGYSEDHTNILKDVDRIKLPKETESKALLNWFLYNVFRLDEVDARDSICDQSNDKGIDGVWADDDSEEIYLFQSKYSANEKQTLGDTDLKEFVGSASWFKSSETVNKLVDSGAHPELKAVVARHNVAERLSKGWRLRLVFVTTRRRDSNAVEYVTALEGQDAFRLDLWDGERLVGYQGLLTRQTRVLGTHSFEIGKRYIEQGEKGKGSSLVAAVRANELASMAGISDRSLFALNVRLPLGRTRVNRELEAAIKRTERHPQFVLFHNGVTVIARSLKVDGETLAISDYSVVNGCQSAIAFFENRTRLTNDLRVLAKFVEVGDDDALAAEITYSTNNQNGINVRDLKANDRIQVALKAEFDALLGGKVTYLIKAGDEAKGETLSNDRAGQVILSLYLNEPYNAHQKYRLFGSEYERIFSRDMSAARIFLGYLAHKAVVSAGEGIGDPLIRGYQLTDFILLGLLGEVLRQDKNGREILEQPAGWVKAQGGAIERSLTRVAKLVVADFNFLIQEKQRQREKEYYDYKSEFKSPAAYGEMRSEILKSNARSIARHPEDAFSAVLKEELTSK